MIAPLPTDSPRVLIVDDESGILESLRILLKTEGFTPIMAQGGRQGIERLPDLRPDVACRAPRDDRGDRQEVAFQS